jgi:hypothetical protein
MQLVAIGDGAIFTSTNSGVAWATNDAPSTNWSSVASSADGALMVAVVNGGGIWTLQATPAPLLRLSRSQDTVTISWIVPSMNFVLQDKPDSSPADWTDATNSPTLNFTNLQYQALELATNGSRFYRLKHQASLDSPRLNAK